MIYLVFYRETPYNNDVKIKGTGLKKDEKVLEVYWCLLAKIRKRPRWKPPEMEWPIVSFLFKSHKMKAHAERLDRDGFGSAAVFHNGIPVRITVSPLSRYAPFKKWIFDEELVMKDSNPPFKIMVKAYESTEYGADKRPVDELQRIAELRAKDEERKKLGLF